MRILETDALASSVTFDSTIMLVELADGRQLSVSLNNFPRLANASQEQRQNYSISGGGTGLHWDELNEDISVPALWAGQSDRTSAN